MGIETTCLRHYASEDFPRTSSYAWEVGVAVVLTAAQFKVCEFQSLREPVTDSNFADLSVAVGKAFCHIG